MADNFQKAAAAIKASGSQGVKLSNEQLGKLYGLYKQATVGDNTTDRPGMLDFTGKAKWDAWTANKGLSQDEAKVQYVALVKSYLEQYGYKDLITW